MLGTLAFQPGVSLSVGQRLARDAPPECDPPPFPWIPQDSVAAVNMVRYAETMRALADTVLQSYLLAIGNQHPAYEGVGWNFHQSVLRIARAAVELNPSDPLPRVLYGEFKWLLAPSEGWDEYARDSTEAREAYRQLVCGRALAEEVGNARLVARADSLLDWIGGMFR